MGENESSELIRAEAVQGASRGPAWNFSVPRGGALWIPDGGDSEMAWLDWLTGIEPPPSGRMFWKGVEWRDRGADESSAERSRMGCTFAAGGLLAAVGHEIALKGQEVYGAAVVRIPLQFGRDVLFVDKHRFTDASKFGVILLPVGDTYANFIHQRTPGFLV